MIRNLEMPNALGTGRIAFVAVLAMASSAAARADTRTRTRVTIRGTGNNVTILETPAPALARRPVFERKAAPDALGEAIELKTEGLDDNMLLAYLRAHEAELPPVIGAAAITRLRRAGAGKPVVAYLASVAAVDVGETGEGREPAVSNAPLPENEAQTPIYGMPYAYPFAGAYAAPFPARRRGSVFSLRNAPFPRRQPGLHRPFPSRVMPGRRRME